MSTDRLKIGRTLLAGGPITQQALQRELERSGKSGSVLGKALLQSGFPGEEELINLVLQRLRIPKINARNTKIPLETIRVIPEEIAKRCRMLAIDQIGRILVVVTPDLSNEDGMAEVRKATGLLVTPIQCAAEGFEEIVGDYYRRLADSGLAPVAPATAAPQGQTGAAAVASTNGGPVKAIPLGDESQDAWWKRYASAGPVPADEAMM